MKRRSCVLVFIICSIQKFKNIYPQIQADFFAGSNLSNLRMKGVLEVPFFLAQLHRCFRRLVVHPCRAAFGDARAGSFFDNFLHGARG